MRSRFTTIKKTANISAAFVVVLSILLSASLLNKKQIDTRSRANITQQVAKKIQLTIDYSKPSFVSKFDNGITQSGNSLLFHYADNNELTIKNNLNLLRDGAQYVNQFSMGNGVLDPWPNKDSAEPGNWDTFDRNMNVIIETNRTPIITLSDAPWWMKGIHKDNTTTLLTEDEEWLPKASTARILDNKIDAWLHLVEKIAERYMKAPYNVRYFQVWDKLNGYSNERGGYDFLNDQGDPSGSNTNHGYTFLYNKTYTRLKETAEKLRISTSEIKIGGPYAPILSDINEATLKRPSSVKGPWGVVDEASLDVIEYWLKNNVGADFLTLSGDNLNRHDWNLYDDFASIDKFRTVTEYVKKLIGSKDIPIWWTEWYITPTELEDTEEIQNTLAAYFATEEIKAGAATILSWNNFSERPNLWSSNTKGDSRSTKWYNTFKTLHEKFKAGTELYSQSGKSDDIEVLASKGTVLIINKKSYPLDIEMNSKTVTVGRYATEIINTP
jgi:hypothetical protein